MSTRRFCCLPSALSLLAIGKRSPKPSVIRRCGTTSVKTNSTGGFSASPIAAGDDILTRERAMFRSFLRAVIKGHLYYGQYPTQAIALTQKVQRIDSPVVAKQIYEDDMLRHNPGGGLEEAAMRKVIERAKGLLMESRKLTERDTKA